MFWYSIHEWHRIRVIIEPQKVVEICRPDNVKTGMQQNIGKIIIKYFQTQLIPLWEQQADAFYPWKFSYLSDYELEKYLANLEEKNSQARLQLFNLFINNLNLSHFSNLLSLVK